MKAIEFLRQVDKLDSIISNKIIEMERWKALAMGTSVSTEGERVQSSGSKQRMQDAVCRYLSIEDDINKYIDELVDKRQEVISTIEQLPTNEYDILHKVYIQHIRLYDVGENWAGEIRSKAWVKKVHRKALCSLQRILDERVAESNLKVAESSQK